MFSLDQEVQESELGLYMMRYSFFLNERGEVVAIIGETDEAVESQLDLKGIQAEPLKAIAN